MSHHIKRATTSIAPTISPKSPPCRIIFLSPTGSSRSPPLPPPHRLAVPHRILFLTFIASICKMAEAHHDAGVAAGDVVKLQGAVTADEVKDVGGVLGGARNLATAADVEKEVVVSASVLPEQKVTASSDAVHPDTPDGQLGKEREVFSLAYVYKGNFASFTAKEVEKIKAKWFASFYNCKIKKWRCPYCTTKPKPKDGRFDHLVSHVEDGAICGEDYMMRGQHAALAKALTLV
ncbi:hypothetical protein D1007_59538 [Hordeum vulgare]|nr:hypothetical protein D1007_59538 [Hordeum vulgare]